MFWKLNKFCCLSVFCSGRAFSLSKKWKILKICQVLQVPNKPKITILKSLPKKSTFTSEQLNYFMTFWMNTLRSKIRWAEVSNLSLMLWVISNKIWNRSWKNMELMNLFIYLTMKFSYHWKSWENYCINIEWKKDYSNDYKIWLYLWYIDIDINNKKKLWFG